MPVESNCRRSSSALERESVFACSPTMMSLLFSGAGRLVGWAAGVQFLHTSHQTLNSCSLESY